MTNHGQIYLVFVDGETDPISAKKVRAWSEQDAATRYLEGSHADHDFVSELEVEVALASQPDARTRWVVSAEESWSYSARKGGGAR